MPIYSRSLAFIRGPLRRPSTANPWIRKHHSFPLQSRRAEVQQDANRFSGRLEVIDHLRLLDRRQLSDSLDFDDYLFKADEIGDILLRQGVALIQDLNGDLRGERNLSLRQFDSRAS